MSGNQAFCVLAAVSVGELDRLGDRRDAPLSALQDKQPKSLLGFAELFDFVENSCLGWGKSEVSERAEFALLRNDVELTLNKRSPIGFAESAELVERLEIED